MEELQEKELQVSGIIINSWFQEDENNNMHIFLDAFKLNQILVNNDCPTTIEQWLRIMQNESMYQFNGELMKDNSYKLISYEGNSLIESTLAISFLLFKSIYEGNWVSHGLLINLCELGFNQMIDSQ